MSISTPCQHGAEWMSAAARAFAQVVQEPGAEVETLVREVRSLPQAEASALLSEIAPIFILVGEPRRMVELAALAVAAGPHDGKAAIVHLDALSSVEDGPKEAAKVGALYAERTNSRPVRQRLVKALDIEGRRSEALREVGKILARWPDDPFARLARIALELESPDSERTFRANFAQIRAFVADKTVDKDLRHDAEMLLALHLGIAGETDEARKILQKLVEEGDEDTQKEANSALKALDS